MLIARIIIILIYNHSAKSFHIILFLTTRCTSRLMKTFLQYVNKFIAVSIKIFLFIILASTWRQYSSTNFIITCILSKTPEAVARRCSVKKVFLEISQKSQKNTCARDSFLIKACNFIKKESLAQAFSCEFYEISKNTYFYRTPLVAASETLIALILISCLYLSPIIWFLRLIRLFVSFRKSKYCCFYLWNVKVYIGVIQVLFWLHLHLQLYHYHHHNHLNLDIFISMALVWFSIVFICLFLCSMIVFICF